MAQSKQFEFLNLLNFNNDFKPLYTQILTGIRIQEHDVVYILDEVGCGKTSSAIIGMASVIQEKGTANILVITPDSVFPQFYEEVNNKLTRKDTEKYHVKYYLKKDNYNVAKNKTNIIFINSHYSNIEKVIGYKWDLIVIDEAHDIICNNLKQLNTLKEIDIDPKYEKYCDYTNDSEIPLAMRNRINNVIQIVNSITDKHLERYIKFFAISEFNNYMYDKFKQIDPIPLDNKLRIEENTTIEKLIQLNAEKLIFLTATFHKYNLEYDYINYNYIASRIINNKVLVSQYTFNISWINLFYSNSINSEAILNYEKSNTSLVFKEITNAIPFYTSDSNQITSVHRQVEIWEEGKEDNNQVFKLRDKLLDLFSRRTDNGLKNRVIIFVSNENEGNFIFKTIYPDSKYNISNSNHYYKEANMSCQFIMGNFKNTELLSDYKEDNENIPDILIITWQVGQVGVNLPTFNYVINFHIPAVPGYLEQRFGRIDRLGTKYDYIYNVYYLNEYYYSQQYKYNLIEAINNYNSNIIYSSQKLPVKNILWNTEDDHLKLPSISDNKTQRCYEELALYVLSYIYQKDTDKDRMATLNSLGYRLSEVGWSTPNMLFDFNNNTYILSTGENVYEFEELINDNEKNNNSTIEIDNPKSRIDNIIDTITKYGRYNNIINSINNSTIGAPGSIIFYDNDNTQITTKSDAIVEAIIKYRNKHN